MVKMLALSLMVSIFLAPFGVQAKEKSARKPASADPRIVLQETCGVVEADGKPCARDGELGYCYFEPARPGQTGGGSCVVPVKCKAKADDGRVCVNPYSNQLGFCSTSDSGRSQCIMPN